MEQSLIYSGYDLEIKHHEQLARRIMGTVLVVDDTDSIRRGLSLLLKQAGYEPITAADGFEALATLDGCRPDLILLDISMPDMDGLSVLEHVRSRPDLASIPVMIYSAVDDATIRQRAVRLGAEFVEKGKVRWDELAPRIGGRMSVGPPIGEPVYRAAAVG